MVNLQSSMESEVHNGRMDRALPHWQRNAPEIVAKINNAPIAQPTRVTQNMTPEPTRHHSMQISPRSVTSGELSSDRRNGLVFPESTPPGGPDADSRHRNRPWVFHGTPQHRANSSSKHQIRSGSISHPVISSSVSLTSGLVRAENQLKNSNSNSRMRTRAGSVSQSISEGSSGISFTTPKASRPPHQLQNSNSILQMRNQADSTTLPSSDGSTVILVSSSRPPPQIAKSNSIRGRRLVKKSSRPSSPTLTTTSNAPSVDSLPIPVATEDVNKILMLMKTLCGKMRGEVEYRVGENGSWYRGICSINEVKGSLEYEGDDRGPFYLTVISDLRGCRVKPISSDKSLVKYLELSNRSQGLEIHMLPVIATDFDLWLAALLCWQQVRVGTLPSSPTRSLPSLERSPGRESTSNPNGAPGGNIIKVAKLLLWDKGAPSSPTAILRRTSTRDLHSQSRSWRKVSCILQDNGEFKLLTENDRTLLSVIQLSQLSRCSIQRLDRSVLDEEFCIAIFPQYASTSTQLSIFRPVYIALESRLTYEVWFCLLRAFTMPEIYGPQPSNFYDDTSDFGICPPQTPINDMFRIEKSINLRISEAKIRKQTPKSEGHSFGKPVKLDTDTSIGHYFAEVILGGEVRARTLTRHDTKNPFWREDCEFHDLPAHLPRLVIVLKRLEHPQGSAYTYLSSSSINNPGQREAVTGTVEIPLENLDPAKDNEAWWPLLDDQQVQVGEMLLRVKLEELVVLLAKDYQPISELLHNFGSGLTTQISQVIPSRLKVLSETFVNIFQVSGHAGEWLTTLVEEEIDGLGKDPAPNHRRIRWSRRANSNESLSAASDREQNVRDMGKTLQEEANLMFRGNSLLTQSLDFHMRRLGKEYLEDVLSDKILEINSTNTDCEVDPSKISHGQDMTKNWSLLIAFTKDIWDSIASSATRCPPELRQILKYIRAVAEDRYGDFLRTVAYTSVSGFLFLRFFCPALLNPKLFGLLKDHPQPKAQRTLTLIAKSLQALANLSSFGLKEFWMEPMNRFLTTHRHSLKEFIDSVCAIPAENTVHALPASYSTPITILSRLPPTSREGFPSLPYLIDHARNFATLVKVWLDATKKYIAPPGLGGELLRFHELCLQLQRRTDDCLLKAEQSDNGTDNPQWEDMAESLKKSNIQDITSHPQELRGPTWTELAPVAGGMQSVTPGSSGSELSSRDGRDRQKPWDQIVAQDVRAQKLYDPMDTSQTSPPSRGLSTDNKHPRSFLGGLRWKGKDTTDASVERDTENYPIQAWEGGMI